MHWTKKNCLFVFMDVCMCAVLHRQRASSNRRNYEAVLLDISDLMALFKMKTFCFQWFFFFLSFNLTIRSLFIFLAMTPMRVPCFKALTRFSFFITYIITNELLTTTKKMDYETSRQEKNAWNTWWNHEIT